MAIPAFSQRRRSILFYISLLSATALSAWSATYAFLSLTPPHEVYDNEKLILAFVYAGLSIPLFALCIYLSRSILRQLPSIVRLLLMLLGAYLASWIVFVSYQAFAQ